MSKASNNKEPLVGRKQRFSKHHDCELPNDELIILPHAAPFASCHSKFLLKLRYLATISRSHADFNFYFRSNAAFTREILRHMLTPRYRFTIHPFSRIASIRNSITCIVWLVLFFFEPYVGCYEPNSVLQIIRPPHAYEVIIRTTNAYEILNVLLNFFTGYALDQTKEVILDPKRIIKHYLRTFFLIDVIPCTSILLFYNLQVTEHILYFIYSIRFIRFLRLLSFIHGFNTILKMAHISDSWRLVLTIFLLNLLIVHWLSCIFGAVPWFYKASYSYSNTTTTASYHTKIENDIGNFSEKYHVLGRYTKNFGVIVLHFYGSDKVFRTKDTFEMIILQITLITGLTFYTISLALVLLTFGTASVSQSKFDELIKQVTEYMAMRRVPQQLRKRVHSYYSFKFDGRYFRDDIILAQLTEHLRMEVLLYSCKTLVDRMQIFKGMTRAAIGTLLARLKEDIYLQGDLIVEYTMPTDKCSYAILYGTCTVHLPSGKEVLHYEDGEQFMDTYDLYKESGGQIRLCVRACEPTQVYTITKKEIKVCTQMYPEIGVKWEQIMKQRVKYYTTYLPYLEEMEKQSGRSTNEILMRLQKNTILDINRRRHKTFSFSIGSSKDLKDI